MLDTNRIVDFYKELRIDRGDSVADIQQQLNEIKLRWLGRSAIAGQRGEEARNYLKMVGQAISTFSDEESKEHYDRQLRNANLTEDETTVDWVSRAWTYYFVKDYGPARVAARKARQHDGDDPTAYVVSAWIELSEDSFKQAEDYASEAYVLDELGQDTFDVHEVRGATFHCNSKYERAIESFQKALSRAPEALKPVTYLRMATSFNALQQNKQALDACLSGLTEAVNQDPDTYKKLIAFTERIIWQICAKSEGPILKPEQIAMAKRTVEQSSAISRAKTQLQQFIAKLERIDQLNSLTATKPEPVDPNTAPDFPAIATGFTAIAFILLMSWPNLFTFTMTLIGCGVLGWYFYQRSNFKQLTEQRQSEIRTYEANLNERSRLLGEISAARMK